MNTINSLIIEGEINKLPDENGKFYIKTVRHSKNENGDFVDTTSHFFVVAGFRFCEKALSERSWYPYRRQIAE